MAVVELTKDTFEEVVTNNEFVIVRFLGALVRPLSFVCADL